MLSFFLPKGPSENDDGTITKTETVLDFLWELMKVVVVSLAIILPVRYFLVQPFYVKGASMEPTYHERDYLIVDEVSYRFQNPERGDVIVFKCASPACGLSRGEYLIKRVIGLPGEQVELREGLVFVRSTEHPEGFYLDERPYLIRGIYPHDTVKVVLSSNEFFVMGDNRCWSFASEDFGPIQRSWIIGRAWIRGWPFSKAGFLPTRAYTTVSSTMNVDTLRHPDCIEGME